MCVAYTLIQPIQSFVLLSIKHQHIGADTKVFDGKACAETITSATWRPDLDVCGGMQYLWGGGLNLSAVASESVVYLPL